MSDCNCCFRVFDDEYLSKCDNCKELYCDDHYQDFFVVGPDVMTTLCLICIRSYEEQGLSMSNYIPGE